MHLTVTYRSRKTRDGNFIPGFVIHEHYDDHAASIPYWYNRAPVDTPEKARAISRFLAYTEIQLRYPSEAEVHEYAPEALSALAPPDDSLQEIASRLIAGESLRSQDLQKIFAAEQDSLRSALQETARENQERP